MKRYKKKVCLIIVILFTLISNGCLTMQYYPARVAKPGKMLVGVGFHWENLADLAEVQSGNYNVILFSGAFIRYGLPYNIDMGLNIHSVNTFSYVLLLPYMLTISARKQIDFNNNLIHSITFDIGYGTGMTKQCYISISGRRNTIAFTVGYKRTIEYKLKFPYCRDEFLTTISKEFRYKIFNIMPSLYCKLIREYQIDEYGNYFYVPLLFNYNNRETVTEVIHIGIGISFYFDLL